MTNVGCYQFNFRKNKKSEFYPFKAPDKFNCSLNGYPLPVRKLAWEGKISTSNLPKKCSITEPFNAGICLFGWSFGAGLFFIQRLFKIWV
jgi:hypothetical protein